MTLERIVETLRQQVDLYRRILEAEREKTTALIHNRIDQMNAIVQKERGYTREAEELENRRIEETRAFLSGAGVPGPAGRIDQLVRAVSDPAGKRTLLALRDELGGLLGELKQVGEQNRQLTKQALEFIDFSVSLLMEDPNEGMVYKHPMNAAYSSRPGTGLFNSRI